MILKFSEVLEIKNGKNQKKVENKNGKYPIYGSGGIIGWANEYLCEKENVIIGRKGSINKPIFVDTPFWNVDTAFGLIANREILDSKYLYYFCLSFDFEKLSTTVTIPSLTKNNLLNIKFDIPSLEKQRKIVKKLDKVQEIIKKYQQELIEFEKLSKSIFIEMFGDPIKNEKKWCMIFLEKLCEEIGDGLHGTPLYDENGKYFFINGNNLNEGKININKNTKAIGVEEYKRLFIKLNKNTILISINGTLGKLAFYNDEEVILGKSVCYCNLKNEINKVFVYEVMNSNFFKEFLNSSSTKSTIKNVSLKTIRNFLLIVPPRELQDKFETKIKAIYKSKIEIQKSIEETQKLFDSLMEKYFG